MSAFSANHIVTIDANRTVKDNLSAVVAQTSTRRRISVTDLVNPRQAYFGRIRTDIEIPPERRQVMMAGTGFHDLFGRAVSTEEYVEQLVEFDGIVGKIDIFEELPIELKTTGSIPVDPLASRTSQVEQLAMYCLMTSKRQGHLLYYQRAEYGRTGELAAFDVEVLEPEPIAQEMRRRRDLLSTALKDNNPSALPRCEWFGKACIYEDICGCMFLDPLVRVVSADSVRVAANHVLGEELEGRIRALPEVVNPLQYGLNDLVFPRRAALRRDGVALPRGEEDDVSDRLESLQRRGFLDVLKDAVWFGTPGSSQRLRTTFGPIRASILPFEDLPTLVRESKRKEMVPRERLAVDAPFYTDRLAFECALAGRTRGRLIVYYSRLEDKFMVYDIWFRDLAIVLAEMQKRLQLLLDGASVLDLPRCEPDWMSRLCDYAEACACREPNQS